VLVERGHSSWKLRWIACGTQGISAR
jgi:hypothetical protein